MRGSDDFVAEPLMDGMPQQLQEPAAVDGILRPAVTGCKTPRFGPDQLSSFRVVGKLGGFNSCFGEAIGQAEFSEHSNGVRKKIDSYAESPDVFSGLEDLDVARTDCAERQCCGQSADTSAANEYTHS